MFTGFLFRSRSTTEFSPSSLIQNTFTTHQNLLKIRKTIFKKYFYENNRALLLSCNMLRRFFRLS